MTLLRSEADAVVIGGGFYGSAIAIYLARRGFRSIVLVEREQQLLQRASYHNQARVHNGYHYPRSLTTAYRSRINLPRFVEQWPQAVRSDFAKLYAIAASNSKVTAHQFERFCREIGAPARPAAPALAQLFEPRLIEQVWEVEEYAFDATQLALWAQAELASQAVHVRLQTRATAVTRAPGAGLVVELRSGQAMEQVRCGLVFNCAYSGINQLAGEFPGTSTDLRHEVTEMALVQVPPPLKDVGVTVMDGPFFSLMPFPARGLHTLSHVRYTPHLHWQDQPDVDPYEKLQQSPKTSRVDRMVRDMQRYLPLGAGVRHVDSLFEVKTVLCRNESDDGRPILFERHDALPGCFSILGGKIDNIFDVLEKLDGEALTVTPARP